MIVILLVGLSLFIWLFLILFWGDFWLCDRYIDRHNNELKSYPTVWIIVPARDEAEVIKDSLTSLLNQKYPGNFAIALVDDNSSDRTAEIALSTTNKFNKTEQFKIISGKALKQGWKGKLWAMQQGIDYAQKQTPLPDYFLFTDADIYHDPDNLENLVTKAETENLDLVSLMVLLRCQSFWEKQLIPAFVFFFQKLYPFSWVNNPQKAIAAAAGGCILISSQALEEIGGIAAIKDALIDDCSLAKAVKSKDKNIWLGLTKTTISLRSYNHLKTIWDTISRTAFTQLNYSWLLLIGTLIGMCLVYLIAPIGLIISIQRQNWLLMGMAITTWCLMAIAYTPTIKLYNLSILRVFSLPAIAFLYTLMTIDSAIKYYQGKGGAWKGRTY
ncbi:glycosyltransferase [Waterburya agarophytonicola K14]|uniref:Glycosyltransferase n=1 Tax=Waterburya agarophytonicola KI4 TaxID=2874699 RepID=A0A964BQB4_9CYAN|nr:glycosyltransferase [Waterburya agarophytonicola]MCC0175970.1 glycosyltransferase [Waterburya agarophytonicola KI4]